MLKHSMLFSKAYKACGMYCLGVASMRKQMIVFDDKLEKAIEDCRSKQRPIPSFASAVNELLWKGLKESK